MAVPLTELLWAFFVAFIIGFVGSVPISGPVSAVVFQSGMKREFRRGFGVAIGSGIVECLYGGIALVGLGSSVELGGVMKNIETYSKIIGGLSIIVIGLLFFTMKIDVEVSLTRKHIICDTHVTVVFWKGLQKDGQESKNVGSSSVMTGIIAKACPRQYILFWH